jgi:tRNA threonylcarbamoyladenosine biosynthesis protein TsaE
MPILNAHSLEIISRSPEQTRRVGMRLGALLEVGDVIGLVGDLGSGKTTLVQGIAAGWGSLDPVSSPSFVLVKLYRRLDGGRFHHLDAYRLSDAAEAEDLDLDALLNVAPLVVEWADRIRAALPAENLWVSLRWITEEQRDLVLTANGDRYQDLLADFRERVFGVM